MNFEQPINLAKNQKAPELPSWANSMEAIIVKQEHDAEDREIFEEFPEDTPTRVEAKKIMKEEHGLLSKYRGHAKKLASVMMLMTAITVGSDVFATEQTPPKTEMQATEQQETETEKEKKLAFETLATLNDIKFSMNIEGDKMEARDMIYFYALERKGLEQGQISQEDIHEAVQELMKYIDAFIGETQGNKDDEINVDEMNEWQNNLGSKPGIQQLFELYLQSQGR